MATTIKLKNGSGAPLAGDLVQGEPALDLTNKRLYTEDSGGSVIEVGTNPTSLTTGTFTSTGIDDNATSTAITIDASENVGIGTASPDRVFHVSRSSASVISGKFESASPSGSQIVFKDADTTTNDLQVRIGSDANDLVQYAGGSERMRIDASGNIGIGTTSPSTQLELSGTNSGSTSDSPAATLRLTDTDTSTAANQPIGKIEFYGNDGTVPSQNVMSYILSKAASTSGGGDLRFGVCSSGAASEAMRIDASGNVGIGTDIPNSLVHLSATGASDEPTLLIQSENSSIFLRTAGSSGSFPTGGGGNDGELIYTGGDFRVGVGASSKNLIFINGSSYNERMRIDSSGNVGIGTTSPTTLIEVERNTTSGTTGFFPEITATNTNAAGVAGFRANGGNGAVAFQLTAFADRARIATLTNQPLTFMTSSIERMRIDSSGNVGIGTGSPITTLTVAEAGPPEIAIRRNVIGTNNGSLGGVSFGAYSSGTTYSQGALIFAKGRGNWSAANQGSELIFATAALNETSTTERMRIDYNGSLLVGKSVDSTTTAGTKITTGNSTAHIYVANTGTTAAAPCLYLNRQGGDGDIVHFRRQNVQVGSISVDAVSPTTNYNTTSDQRLKKNIVDAPAGNIDDIRVRSFDWKKSDAHQAYGLIAQELIEIAPEAVTKGEAEEDIWVVDYSKLVPMMIKEIQDLKAEVTALKGA